MKIEAIHQYVYEVLPADGVGNCVFFIQKLLRSLGVASEIYSDCIDSSFVENVRPTQEYCDAPGQLLLVHHYVSNPAAEWLLDRQDPILLVYHNITPSECFASGHPLASLCREGREQLVKWVNIFHGAIALSPFSARELTELGYRQVSTLPIAVDAERCLRQDADPKLLAALRDGCNVLFVGRIVEHKCQHDLIAMFDMLLRQVDFPVRLILAGKKISPDYVETIKKEIVARNLQDDVMLCGPLNEAELAACYHSADVFVSMSEHEGFGMPLIEASLHGIPVLAYAAGSVPDTLGSGGLLFHEKDPRVVAALLKLVLTQPSLRLRILSEQYANLARFDSSQLLKLLREDLAERGYVLPTLLSKNLPSERLRLDRCIDGPFDSSYSLAIVNRETACAQARAGYFVGVSGPEYALGRQPDWTYLSDSPEMQQLWQNSQVTRWRSQVLLRNNYPPLVSDMRAQINVLNGYAWEESAFPCSYVTSFNRKLDLITVVSSMVKKILRDNGVTTPIVVVGNGVDHLVDVEPSTRMPLGKGFRFLHISSCFPRKGVDLLLKAWGQAFRKRDDVSLIIKTFPNPHNDIERQLAAYQSTDPDYPDVVLINEDLPDSAVAALYRNCHAFVAPSRAEGFGLPFAEAMLAGLPVIVTTYGGHTDFCTENTAWLVDYHFSRADNHLGLCDSTWVEPNVDHLAQRMREVRRLSSVELLPRLENARRLLVERYSWQSVSDRIDDAINTLGNAPLFTPEPAIGWISTYNSKCGIATYSERLLGSFPSERVTLLANTDAHLLTNDPDNLVRCWHTGSDCLDLLKKEICDRSIKATVFQFNYAFMPLPALAELIRWHYDKKINFYVFLHNTHDPSPYVSLGQIADSLALASRILVHSIEDLNRLKMHGLVNNVTLFPHGVYPASQESPNGLRDALGMTGKRVIASYGFLLPHKGIKQLLRAFHVLRKKHEDLHLLLVNACYPEKKSEEEKLACEKLIVDLDLQESVTFNTRFLSDDDSLALLGLAELIVYPYQYTQESASGAVRMGIAAGRSVVVTPLPIFIDVEDAVIQLPGIDFEEIACGLDGLLGKLSDPSENSSLNTKADLWRKMHQFSSLSQRLLALIDGSARDVER